MQLQIVFDRIEETKSKIRVIKSMYRDELKGNGNYKDTVDKIKQLQATKKQIEKSAKEGMTKAFDELAYMEASMRTDRNMLAEVALNDYTSGVTVKITKKAWDRKGVEFEKTLLPKFSVTFKKE